MLQGGRVGAEVCAEVGLWEKDCYPKCLGKR